MVACHVTLEKCDKSSHSSPGSGSVVGGGKRIKTQPLSKPVVSRGRGKLQPAVVIDKEKFYSTDQLLRPPLRRTRRNISPRNHQLCKSRSVCRYLLIFCWSCNYSMDFNVVCLTGPTWLSWNLQGVGNWTESTLCHANFHIDEAIFGNFEVKKT